MLVLPFSSRLDFCSYIFSITKTASKKIGALFVSINFFLLRLLFISMNVPYGLSRNLRNFLKQVLVIITLWFRLWLSYAYTKLEPKNFKKKSFKNFSLRMFAPRRKT